MKPRIISIIGGNGKMGRLFKEAFCDAEYEVLVADIGTKYSNKEVAQKGDIIIISVPIRKTKEIIEEIGPYVREDAMITDFTSVKVNPVKEMTKVFLGEVIGGHPLFGPSTGIKDQNFILCKERKGNYYDWYKAFLESIGLHVIEMSADEHDKNMAVIQCLIHFSNLALGSSLEKLGYDLEFAKKISSPVYLLRIYGAGRILAQDEKLYSDIQIENPYSKEIARTYKDCVDKLFLHIAGDDKKAFEEQFILAKNYFGVICDESMSVTDKLTLEMKKHD